MLITWHMHCTTVQDNFEDV